MPLIGILGGMGTMATAAFYEKLHSLQSVETEQQYIDVLMYSKPSIPDRTQFILGKSKESPLAKLIEAAKTLETAGVTTIALPCMTSHYFYDELARSIKTKILNFPEETVKHTLNKGYKKVVLLATEGTIKAKVLQSKFEAAGVEVALPDSETQAMVSKIIYDIKKGELPPTELPPKITKNLTEQGAKALILGCTELCLNSENPPNHIDTLEILARATLRECKS